MALSLALVSLTGLAMYYLFLKLRLPGLLGMMLAGLLTGPYLLDILHPDLLRVSADFRQIALVIILLRAGFEIRRRTLARIGFSALLLSFVPTTVELCGVILVAPPLLGISRLDAAILGAILASVAPAIIVPRMIELQRQRLGTDKDIPALLMASSSAGNVYVLILFTALLGMAGGGDDPIMASLAGIPVSMVLGAVAGVGVGLALVWFFKHVHLRDTWKTLAIVSVAILLTAAETALSGRVPFSGLLAIVVVGVVLLERYETLVHRMSGKFEKIWIFAQLLLFVLVGTQIDPQAIVQAGFAGCAVIAAALAFRSAGVLLSLLGSRLTMRERMYCVAANLPKATVQAAIGAVPLAAGLPAGGLMLAIAILSILTTAPLGDLLMKGLEKKCLTREPDPMPAIDPAP